MRQDLRLCAGSQQGLQVGAHDVLHPADARKPEEFVEPNPLPLPIELECLKRDIKAELVTILEAVSESFFRGVDRYRDTIQRVGCDACGKGLACEPKNPHR